jgi:hypothetical protein
MRHKKKRRAKRGNGCGCGIKCSCCGAGYLKNPTDACCTSCGAGGMCSGPVSNPPKFTKKEFRRFAAQMRRALQKTLRCKTIPRGKLRSFAKRAVSCSGWGKKQRAMLRFLVGSIPHRKRRNPG